MDETIPTEEELQKYKEKALLYLNDIKSQLEGTMQRTTFHFIFPGSAMERYGIPFTLHKPTGCVCACNINALLTDLNVMFCSAADSASFSGQGNILVEPLVTDAAGFRGYAKLTSLIPGFEGNCVSSKRIRDQTSAAVENMLVLNLPSVSLPFCCGMPATPKIKFDYKGPAVKTDQNRIPL